MMQGINSPLRLGALPPRRLLRLADVISFDAQRLHHLLSMIAGIESALASEEKARGRTVRTVYYKPGDDISADLGEELLGHMEALGLSSCIPAMKRLKNYLQMNPRIPPEKTEALRELFRQVRFAIYDALEEPRLIAIELRHARLFEPEGPPFGQKVFETFMEAQDDIEEAGKCLALGRNKACVFHLMLAMETALRALGKKLGATLVNKDGKPLTWLIINNNIKAKVEALPDGVEKVQLLSLVTMLHSVGNAWRNPTMHPAQHYDEMQAEAVYNAVRGFMREVANAL